MDQARQTLAWTATFTARADVNTWIKQVRQARASTSDDTSSRRGSTASSTPDDAHKEWERARAAAILDGRMSFDDERRAVWEENPDYPFAAKSSTVSSSCATAVNSTHGTSKVPVVKKPLGWDASSSSSTIRPPHMKMKEAKPDAWLNSSPNLPTKPPSARIRSSSADSEWTLTPSDYAYRPSWLQTIESGPYAHRTDAPPITRLYAGPGAQVRDHIAMGSTTVEFVPKSAQLQRPAEVHHAPERTGSGAERSAEVLYGGSQERLQQIPLGLRTSRQKELGASYSSLPPPTSSGESLFPPVYGTSIQGDLEKADGKSGVVGVGRVGRAESVKRVVVSGKFGLWVMAVLLLVLICVCLPLAVMSRR